MLRNRRGLTLIEILAAMTILGLVVVLFASVSNYSTVRTSKGDIKYNALLLAENELKQLVYDINQTSNPEVGSQDAKFPVSINGYTIHVDEFPFAGSNHNYKLSTPTDRTTQVSVQAIVNLYNGATPESTIITVTVSWGG